MNGDGAEEISNISLGHFALEAADSVFQEVGRFSQFRRTDPMTDVFLVEIDLPRGKADSRMQMGGAFSGAVGYAPCLQDAALSRPGKSLALASAKASLGFPAVARQMRQPCGPYGGAVGKTSWLLQIWMRSRRERPISWHGLRFAMRKSGAAKRRGRMEAR